MLSKKTAFIIGIVIVLATFGVNATAYAQEKVKVPTLVFASGAVGGTWHPIASATPIHVDKERSIPCCPAGPGILRLGSGSRDRQHHGERSRAGRS